MGELARCGAVLVADRCGLTMPDGARRGPLFPNDCPAGDKLCNILHVRWDVCSEGWSWESWCGVVL